MPPRPQTVLVTAVGGVIGCGIVRSLRMSGRVSRIIGADIYPDATGKHWCDEFLQTMPAADRSYFDDLCDHLDHHEVDLVIPGTEEEVLALHDNRSRKLPSGTQIVLNTPEVIECA